MLPLAPFRVKISMVLDDNAHRGTLPQVLWAHQHKATGIVNLGDVAAGGWGVPWQYMSGEH